ncbi:MAG: ATP-binding protein [Myxococcota bacterium]
MPSGRLAEIWRSRWIAIACVLPALVALGVAMVEVVADDEPGELECWILPNDFVLRPPGTRHCRLRTNDRVVAAEPNPFVRPYRTLPPGAPRFDETRSALEITIDRTGEEHDALLRAHAPAPIIYAGRVGAAAVLVGVLMAIPLILGYRKQDSPAVPAMAILYGAIAFATAVGTTTPRSGALTIAGLLALAIAPAALLHLAITFPRVRPLVALAPEIVWLPYGSLVLLLPMGIFALLRTPIVWPAYLGLLTFLLGIAWAILLMSCHAAWVDSESSLERARARLLLVSACAIPAPIAVALAPPSPTLLELAATLLWTSAIVLPVAIALAVSRYDLLDGPRASRSWLGTIAHVSAGSIAIGLLLGVAAEVALPSVHRPDVSLVFLLAFACSTGAEVVRSRTAKLSEMLTTPGVTKLNDLHARFQAEVAGFATVESLLDALASLVSRTLGCRGVSILLVDAHGYAEAQRTGEAFTIEPTLPEQAVAALRGLPVAHTELMEDQPGAPSVERLQKGGVRVIAELRHRSQPVGLVLLSARRDGAAYTGTDLEFVARTCETAAGALHALQVASRLAGARGGALQTIAEAVSHDLGKEVDWVTRLVRRLPEAAADRDRLRRDIELVLDITSNLTRSLNDLLGRAAIDGGESIPVDVATLLESAIRHADVLHGPGRVEPVLGDIESRAFVDRSLERVVSNLVDNALHASSCDAPVRVFASVRDRFLRIDVEDRGCGIADDAIYRLFEAGFTTRRERGGQGIGLATCRDIVAELEGAMEIGRASSGGTRATVLVPIH